MANEETGARPWRGIPIGPERDQAILREIIVSLAAEDGILAQIAMRLRALEDEVRGFRDALPVVREVIQMRPDRTYIVWVSPASDEEVNQLVQSLRMRGLDAIVLDAEHLEVGLHARPHD